MTEASDGDRDSGAVELVRTPEPAGAVAEEEAEAEAEVEAAREADAAAGRWVMVRLAAAADGGVVGWLMAELNTARLRTREWRREGRETLERTSVGLAGEYPSRELRRCQLRGRPCSCRSRDNEDVNVAVGESAVEVEVEVAVEQEEQHEQVVEDE